MGSFKDHIARRLNQLSRGALSLRDVNIAAHEEAIIY